MVSKELRHHASAEKMAYVPPQMKISWFSQQCAISTSNTVDDNKGEWDPQLAMF